MKKAAAAITAFLLCAINMYALDNLHFNLFGVEYAAGIEARWGVSGLQMTETVYKNSSSGGLLSEIDWDIGAQITAGTGLSAGPVDLFGKTGFSLGGMFLWCFPVNDRSMKDTDWDDAGNIYSYGESMVSTLAGMEAEGRLAVHFPIRNKYLIEIMAEVWYSRYAAIAHDGWTSWDGSDEKIPLYGAAIEYIQEWITVAPCLGFRWKLNNTHFGIRAAVSPLIWGYHIDNHYFRALEGDDLDQRYIRYTDKTRDGIMYKIQADWFWNVTRYVQIGGAVNYRAVENSRGDTIVSTAGLADYSFLEKGIAGAAARTIGFDLTIRMGL